jgi:hypothetical protein
MISAERLKDNARLPIEWDAQQRFLADLGLLAPKVMEAKVCLSLRLICSRRRNNPPYDARSTAVAGSARYVP